MKDTSLTEDHKHAIDRGPFHCLLATLNKPHLSTMEPLGPPLPVAMSKVAASWSTRRRTAGASSLLSTFLSSVSARFCSAPHTHTVTPRHRVIAGVDDRQNSRAHKELRNRQSGMEAERQVCAHLEVALLSALLKGVLEADLQQALVLVRGGRRWHGELRPSR